MKLGEIYIFVSLKNGKDSTIIGDYSFTVKEVPPPPVLLAPNLQISGDSIDLKEFLKINFLYCGLNELNVTDVYRYTIISYTVLHFRGDSVLKIFQMKGYNFGEEFKTYKETAFKKGDKVLFCNIKGSWNLGLMRLLPLELQIRP